MQKHSYSVTVGGREIIIESGSLAKLAGGAVTVRSGDSLVLGTVCGAAPREGIDFFPLSVDFEERLYAAGRIPGSFMRREGRPSDQAILVSRLIDRPLRPLFPKDMRNEVQVIVTAMARDPELHLDILGIIAASAAVTISDIPWDGPIGAVRVGFVDGEFIINPTVPQMAASTLDLRMAGTADAILMVEAGADELPEDMMLEALRLGHEAMQPIIELQNRMRAEIGKPKFEYTAFASDPVVEEAVSTWIGSRMRDIFSQPLAKQAQSAAMKALHTELVAALGETYDPKALASAFDSIEKKVVRDRILGDKVRPDERAYTEIRPITVEVGVLRAAWRRPDRGRTQVLTVATLGTPGDAQSLDTLSPENPSATCTTTTSRPSRRAKWQPRPAAQRIGRPLAALEPMIPAQESFPYTLRLVSAAVLQRLDLDGLRLRQHAGALMDAGVPIKAPVAGIAMGLVTDGDVTSASLRYAILSDIQGIEDHLGDMDFKVAGTAHGITACQMDIKIHGLTFQILEEGWPRRSRAACSSWTRCWPCCLRRRSRRPCPAAS